MLQAIMDCDFDAVLFESGCLPSGEEFLVCRVI